jgi:hypothetical protein
VCAQRVFDHLKDLGRRSCGGAFLEHPAYLLRQPEAKRQAWRDLLQLKAALDGTTEGKLS